MVFIGLISVIVDVFLDFWLVFGENDFKKFYDRKIFKNMFHKDSSNVQKSDHQR